MNTGGPAQSAIAEADDRAKKEYVEALSEATARFQAAESALAQVRIRSAATKEFSGSADVRKLEHDMGTLQLPEAQGGANWPGGAYDPESGIVYV